MYLHKTSVGCLGRSSMFKRMRTRDQVVFVMGSAFVFSCAHTRPESIVMTSALCVCLSMCVYVRLLFQVM
jgi:hypothetical protein